MHGQPCLVSNIGCISKLLILTFIILAAHQQQVVKCIIMSVFCVEMVENVYIPSRTVLDTLLVDKA